MPASLEMVIRGERRVPRSSGTHGGHGPQGGRWSRCPHGGGLRTVRNPPTLGMPVRLRVRMPTTAPWTWAPPPLRGLATEGILPLHPPTTGIARYPPRCSFSPSPLRVNLRRGLEAHDCKLDHKVYSCTRPCL